MSKTLPKLAEGCQVVLVDAKDLLVVGTLHHFHSTYDPQSQERVYDYRFAWVYWPLGKRKEHVCAITTPEDWKARREAPKQASVAGAWTGDGR